MSFMRVHASRKLFLFGRYSLALLLPKKWLTELGAERGSSIEIQLDRARKRIVLRFGSNSNNYATISTPKTPSKKNPSPTDSDPELQPIPEL